MLNHKNAQIPDTFAEDFLEFSVERLNASHKIMIGKSKRYIECHEEQSRLFKAVSEALGPEHRKLLSRLDEAHGSVLSAETDAAYVQGLRDGARLQDILFRGLDAISLPDVTCVAPENGREG